MKPAPFEYVIPNSLDAALEILSEHADSAKVLAGGQSLVPAMNFRVAQPALLVDLNALSELDYIRRSDNGELHFGAMTRQRRLERDALVTQYDPLLHETMPNVAHPQIRNRGTFGGSIAHADPAAELPVYIVARRARLRFQSKRGERWVAHDECFLGLFTTALEPDELLVEIVVPPFPKRTGCIFMEVARRRGDYAMAGVAAWITLNDDNSCAEARLVYLNAGDVPFEAKQAQAILQGQSIDKAAIEAAASSAAQEVDPLGNVHASVEYQRHLVNVLTRRALKQATERAMNNSQ